MRLIGFFIAVVLAAGAAFMVMKLQEEPPEEKEEEVRIVKEVVREVEEVPKVDIMVARQPIEIGVPLTPELVDYQPWPEHLVLDDFIIRDEKGNIGLMQMVTRAPFQTREPIIRSKLANPDDPSFLAAALGKGMRATTIAVDSISAVAGFVYPGDRVDVLITHRVQTGSDVNAGNEQITEILLPNVKVIAVDQRATVNTGEGPMIPATVTLEVSQSDVQKLRLAEQTGTLSLALRSMEDKDAIDLATPTGVADLSRVTPPTYFPILYDNITHYEAQVVDPYAEEKEKAKATREKPKDLSELLPEPIAQPSAPAAPVGGGSVTIYRGVESSIVEVNRP